MSEIHGGFETVGDFAELGRVLEQLFGAGSSMWHRDPGFFVFVDATGRPAGSLEFSRDEWHLRRPSS